jgi:hypothetical protein
MTTVVRRAFRSSPYRDAPQTWAAIVDVLTQRTQAESRRELESVAGIVASCIADMALQKSPMVITCSGPRTRIYCLYDDDAIGEADAQEGSLGFDPLKGEWAISIPCLNGDLQWVQSALKKLSTRITAREVGTEVLEEQTSTNTQQPLVIDIKGFLGK